MARRYLAELQQEDSSLEVEEIDILSSPRRSFRDGIRMIPAVRSGDQILGSVFLTKAQITDFIKNNHPST